MFIDLFAIICCLSATASSVTLIQDHDTWRLTNELVEVAIDTRDASVAEFRFRDGENVLYSHGAYIDSNTTDGFFGGIGSRNNPTTEAPVIYAQTPDYIDVMVRGQLYKSDTSYKYPLVFDWHVVLQKGEPGFHTYVVAQHQAGAEEMGLGQLRFILWVDRFEDYVLTPTRTGHLRDHEWKYTLTRSWEPWNTHGLVNPETQEAIWAVYGSKRWCRGPDQRDLTQHIDADSGIAVILTMLEAGHYGVFPTSRSSEIRIHEGWRKIYGPVFYMLTQGGSAQEMYEQAAARGIVDRDQWPPPWLAEAVGPLTTVTGQIAPNSIDEPVRVVLNNDRYVFWATCQPGEAFQIPDVSPDTYRLTARQGPHAIAQLSDVQIGQDAFDAGEIQLTPAIPPGKILWEIGTLDDSCEEFSGGHHCWEFHGYEAYASEAQDPCVYTIGQSRPERDWYWIHPGPIDGWAGGKIHPRTIQFELETIPENPLLLHIALADTMSAAHIPPPIYHVQLNDQELAVIELSDGGQAGSYCVASVGVPQNYRVSISPESLVVGVNRLVIYPKEQSYVMYDYLALQEPDVLPH